MIDAVRRMFAYQDWAMEQIWPTMEQLSEIELDAPGCSGNGSIRQTMTHLIRAQDGWFRIFEGRMSLSEMRSTWWKGDDYKTLAEAHSAWLLASDRAKAYVKYLSDEDAAVRATPELYGKKKLAAPLGELLLHVANHGTHTRAQIAASIRRFGKNPGVLEYLKFATS